MQIDSPRLEWGPQFRTDIKILDEQHQVLFDLVNRVEDILVAAPVDTLGLERAIEGVVSYAMYHFITEESLAYRMRATANIDEHLRQHHGFRKKLAELQEESRCGDPIAVAGELLRYLKHWLVSHILVVDTALGREIRQSADRQTAHGDGLRIAVVEDNRDLREEIVFYLSHVGHRVVGLENGAALNRHMMTTGSDVIVLDLGLPDIDGMDLIARYGGRSDVAIVVMTARGSTDDRIAGYRGGADAYLVKPVDLRELVAVVDQAARRLYPSVEGNLHAWRFSPTRWMLVTPGEEEIILTEQQASLVGLFASAGRRVLTRREIALALGWQSAGHEGQVAERMEAGISRLRHRLEESGVSAVPLKTIRGVGYSFTAPLVVAD